MTTPAPKPHKKYVRTVPSVQIDRVAELDHLTNGHRDNLAEAVRRAGWPTTGAAARALYRAHHPLAAAVENLHYHEKRSA